MCVCVFTRVPFISVVTSKEERTSTHTRKHKKCMCVHGCSFGCMCLCMYVHVRARVSHTFACVRE